MPTRHLVIDLDQDGDLIDVLSALLTHHPDEPCPCQTEGYEGKDVHDHIVTRSPVASVRIRGMGLAIDLEPDQTRVMSEPSG